MSHPWRAHRFPEEHKDCDSRVGDAVRECLADSCLTARTFRRVMYHIDTVHHAKERFRFNVWLAFNYPLDRRCAQDSRETCYVTRS